MTLTIKQAARLWGKNEKTVRRWIKARKIEAERNPGGRGWWVLLRRDGAQ